MLHGCRKFYNKSFEAKYQFLINKREGGQLKEYHDSKDFIKHSNDMDDIYENKSLQSKKET